MRTGEVAIDFEKMKQQYPLVAIHVLDVLSDKKNVSYDVRPEDNQFIEPSDQEHRVRISYTEPEGKTKSFTLLMEEKFIQFTVHS